VDSLRALTAQYKSRMPASQKVSPQAANTDSLTGEWCMMMILFNEFYETNIRWASLFGYSFHGGDGREI
jgi:hypothetical protein